MAETEETKRPISSEYYAWSSGMKARAAELEALGASTGPTRLEVVAAVEVSCGGSAWNTAGTWEDRVVTEWATPKLKAAFQALQVPLPGDTGTIQIQHVDSCTGEASLVFVRGKLRAAYEYAIKCKWSVETPAGHVEGKLEVPDLCDSSADVELSVSVSKAPAGVVKADIAKAAKTALTEAIEQLVPQWVETMKAQMK